MDAFEVLWALVHAWWQTAYSIICVTVMQVALDMVDPPALSDEALREHHHQVSLKFSVVKDLTIDQYRKVLGQRLAQAHPLHPQAIATIEEVSEAMDEWDVVDSNSRSCSNKRSFPRRLLCRFSPLSWVLGKKKRGIRK